MSARVSVRPEVIEWAIETSGKEPAQANKKFPIEAWLKEERKPTAKQLVNFSEYTHVPIGYLMLPRIKKEKLPLLDYRTVNSEKLLQPSRELVDVIQDMERKQGWMRDYLQRTNHTTLAYVNSVALNMDPVKVAHVIRETLNLNKNWYINFSNSYEFYTFLKKQVQALGVLVFQDGTALGNTHRALDVQEFRAFSLVDSFAPLIFINAKDSYNGKVFSLIHELVHIFIGENSLYNDSGKNGNFHHENIEKFCNAVTAEIVVPSSELKAEWNRNEANDLSVKIEVFSKVFTISKWVVARRLKECNYISDKEYKSIIQLLDEELSNRVEEKNSGGNFYNNVGSRLDPKFVHAIYEGINSGIANYKDIYRLTRLKNNQFEEVRKNFLEGGE